MLTKPLFATVATVAFAVPLIAQAEPMDRAEAQMFQSATLSLEQAGQSALKVHAGDLAAVAFNDEDGRGVYEATVVGADGEPWTVKVDAKSGDVLASGMTALMVGDHPDGTPLDDHEDGERDDD
ncbi:PepSY domain-containing protein [Rhodospirillum sp. A1_3_36]|uniref:PepSY domain-containing protein n=1 Tax=Rhodospirillum sp. A1_3_36 TaxID=3391666 RepID=UPI0039A5C4A6